MGRTDSFIYGTEPDREKIRKRTLKPDLLRRETPTALSGLVVNSLSKYLDSSSLVAKR